ncbi:glycosyltransferase [Oerskovia jenensis]|uniref:4,4'-diaponeurosporenoate glycosyltransferase n=1 Tax=Oerskovia jenensis TaxID=162169 RepID=A0ABS2LKN6_9CELL|nr:glycosyltransferase [Oerskovia jenensis]MBM7480998.1 glycosyltransferase involved in cell wall biosynthesis [Oerskovia jenensis]
MSAPDRVTRLAVVVPVNDEEALLPRCLEALEVAVANVRAERPALRVAVVVVLDDCRDGSAAILRSSPFAVIEVGHRRVGAARAAGVAAATDLLGRGSPARLWIASTDADSAVPPQWLTHQLALAEDGADLVVGTVRPDFDDLSPAQQAAWVATHPGGRANGHVHGANLGVRGDVYRAAGGFPGLAEHEDVGLVARARAAGARVVASDGGRVLTSGRPTGRTPGGYARHLREDLVRDAQVG